MGISLPNPGEVYLPDVPSEITKKDKDLGDYLGKLKLAVEDGFRGQFSNTFAVATAMNRGTSGTFVISSGGSIIVTSGVVITVTS